jgi:hypothetical protein
VLGNEKTKHREEEEEDQEGPGFHTSYIGQPVNLCPETPFHP